MYNDYTEFEPMWGNSFSLNQVNQIFYNGGLGDDEIHGSTKTTEVVWCSKRGDDPNFAPNSDLLSELQTLKFL